MCDDRVRYCGVIDMTINRCSIPGASWLNKPDLFVVVSAKPELKPTVRGRWTGSAAKWPLMVVPPVRGSRRPEFNSNYPCLVDFRGEHLESTTSIVFEVCDDDGTFLPGEDGNKMGSCEILMRDIVKEGSQENLVLNLAVTTEDKENAEVGTLEITYKWIPLVDEEDSPTVPHTKFPVRHGNSVSLFHDADVCEGFGEDLGFTHDGCWKRLSADIEKAQQFIYIVGWSVNTSISLIRSEAGDDETVGDLLKRKSEEGVKVVLVLWNDITSDADLGTGGMMGTADEETKSFFYGSKVKVILMLRQATGGPMGEGLNAAIFTHHQKAVVMDTPCDSEARRIVCFWGGIDITSGRWDDQNHYIMGKTLKTAHKKDFYNGCLVDATIQTGPREPWHDIHGRVEGPVAYDFLQNFVDRVEREASLSEEVQRYVEDLKEKGALLDQAGTADCGEWHSQLFRSIDFALDQEPHHGIVKGMLGMMNSSWKSLPSRREIEAKEGDGGSEVLSAIMTPIFALRSVIRNAASFWERVLQSRVNPKVENDIQQAYIYQINRAKRFVYVENQYFLGSAQYWHEHQHIPCYHLIPDAICAKIESKIADEEPFCAYALIPLFPEGVPDSKAVQEILQWQFQTMRMMYSRVIAAIHHAGLEDERPTDFLQFYFAGQRDVPLVRGKIHDFFCGEDKKLENALTSRRHQIYVHSKMMIVDDEYVILGSANINQRSMDGQRDSELAAGNWQPEHRMTLDGADASFPTGDVARFRKALWLEHFGQYYDEFNDPGHVDCARMARSLAQDNLAAYMSEEIVPIPNGHMCAYPLSPAENGELEPVTEMIPDMDAPVVGYANVLPDILTT